MLSENQEEVTIHGIKHVRTKRAPEHKQLPKFEQSKAGPPFTGVNTKVEPDRASELRIDIKKMDGEIARLQRRIKRTSLAQEYKNMMMARLPDLQHTRANLQAERAYIMQQANPKKVIAPKLRPMRRKPARFRKEVVV